jgi:predicted nucleic acid-binding protein
MDSDVTIALLKSHLMHILGCLGEFQFMITETNYAEITRQSERAELDAANSGGHVIVRELSSVSALAVFADLLTVIDEGEAAVIALANQLGSDVAMHDKVGRRHAKARLSDSRVYRLEDIFVEAVRAGCLSIAEAERATILLAQAGDYQPDYGAGGITQAIANPNFGLNRGGQKT